MFVGIIVLLDITEGQWDSSSDEALQELAYAAVCSRSWAYLLMFSYPYNMTFLMPQSFE